jgi:hypothetical protein
MPFVDSSAAAWAGARNAGPRSLDLCGEHRVQRCNFPSRRRLGCLGQGYHYARPRP